jgi:hypothetical protein
VLSRLTLSQVGPQSADDEAYELPSRRLLLALMGILGLLATLAYAHRRVLAEAPVELASRRAGLAFVGLPIAAVVMLAILASGSTA